MAAKYAIGNLKDASKAYELVTQKKLRVIKEGGEIFLHPLSGGKTLSVAPNFRYMFKRYLEREGNGDGFFPETSQTAN